MFIYKDASNFPEELTKYGCSEGALAEVFTHLKNGRKGEAAWKLQCIPNVGFYQNLHVFLKRWILTKSANKTLIGQLYIAIDPTLQAKGCRPDNVYRFMERVAGSRSPQSALMNYNIQASELTYLQTKVKEHTSQMEELTTNFSSMKQELEKTKQQLENAKKELKSTQSALKDATNKLNFSEKQQQSFKSTALICGKENEICRSDFLLLENALEEQTEQNATLSMAMASMRTELALIKGAESVEFDNKTMTFSFKTTTGTTMYLPAIRKLYYTLLADQIPPAKIESTIKAVLKCFLPNLNAERLKLPKEKCAGYMRREELKTISMAHKATLVDNLVAEGMVHINTDGTTKFQKKLGATAVNGIVLSVNELADGTADSVIRDISKQLHSLRETAKTLNLPNANHINWTLVASSTSDSASSQKRLNKLIEQQREADRKTFGSATQESMDIVENFCSMHLGINLRKAFLDGIKSTNEHPCESRQREHHTVDILVHEFCKIFGRHGTPEYGCGVLSFPDFLAIKLQDSGANKDYFLSCQNTILERQVGSRYFVTAANAAKILYLKEAAIAFLEYTGKYQGNKLEKEVYTKLQDICMMTQLKTDSLMFYHIYADLVMLSKSNDLEKSAFDMNQHYLELKLFLEEIEHNPLLVMDEYYRVFTSEKRLYGSEKDVNHRLRIKSQHINKNLFIFQNEENELLLSMISEGAAAMRKKLLNYAKNQLPGGKYWDPEERIKATLKELNPSNDLCESILGLNDYLTTAIPNLHQVTKSNLTELKKNKTIPWLNEQEKEVQDSLVELACRRKTSVFRDFKEEEEIRTKQRRERMISDKQKRDAFRARNEKQRDELSKLHLITTTDELTKALLDIDQEKLNASKKAARKLALLRTQVKIRKQVLKQNIRITFTHNRKQRPVHDIAKELSLYIDNDECPKIKILHNPSLLVGSYVHHRFAVKTKEELHAWFRGYVIAYDDTSNLHEIAYDDEDEHCYFDLTQDLIMGDLIIL